MLNYVGEYCEYGTASTASTATPGMHEASAVPMRVLRNEATLPSMCVGMREWAESFGCPFQELAFVSAHFLAYPCQSVCKTAL